MNDVGLRRLWSRARASLAVAGLIGLALTGRPVAAEETNSQQSVVATASLGYRELDSSYLTWGPQVTQQPTPFKKEPSLNRGRIVRAVLKLGGGATNDLGFVWDRSARKLYLDLNRNLDLTDDPGGAFEGKTDARQYGQTFSGIHIPFHTEGATLRMLVDVTLRETRRLNCSVAIRSFWDGKVTLNGDEWQVGVLRWPLQQHTSVENSQLLLRPWADHAKPFSQYGDSLEVMPFPRKLFLRDHAYELRCVNESSSDGAKLLIKFTEQKPTLGELKVAGAFVRRAILEGGAYQVVLDNPGPTVKVPVGSYGSAKVYLQKGPGEAYLDVRMQPVPQRISVKEKAPAVLTAGGPLTNSVSVMKRGRNLMLIYQLDGLGGHYQMVNQDRAHPPEFMVFAGGRKIASGKFQYG